MMRVTDKPTGLIYIEVYKSGKNPTEYYDAKQQYNLNGGKKQEINFPFAHEHSI